MDKNTTIIDIEFAKLQLNEGQLEGLPANPREINDVKFDLLKKNISEHPEFLRYNPLKVYPLGGDTYIIIGGNMRYRALSELGYTSAPCVVISNDTSIEQLQAYVILDNSSFGRWEWSMLANEWSVDNLKHWGVDVPIFEPEVDPKEVIDDEGEDVKLTVKIPSGYADKFDVIKSLIEIAVREYPGIKVK